MKILDAIAELHQIFEECGDLELVGLIEVDGRFAVDFDRFFGAIAIPNEDDENGPEEVVCAFMEPMIDDPNAEPERTFTFIKGDGGGPPAA